VGHQQLAVQQHDHWLRQADLLLLHQLVHLTANQEKPRLLQAEVRAKVVSK
jgi:hypothetical protein